MKKPESQIRESIRKHLYRIITAGKNGDKLPSEQELCNTFGVARGTLRSVLKTYIEEELITVNKGSGMFIKKTPQPSDGLLIGITIGNGRHAFFEYYSGMITTGSTYYLCSHGHCYNFLENPTESNRWADGLAQIKQTGFLWVNPSTEGMLQLTKQKIPVVALGACYSECSAADSENSKAIDLAINGVFLDEYHEGSLFTKHCIENRHRKMIIISPWQHDSLFMKGVHATMLENNLVHTDHLIQFQPAAISRDKIECAINQGYTGIYCDYDTLLFTHKVLKSSGFSHGTNCLLLTRDYYSGQKYPEIEYDIIDCQLDEIGKRGAKLLLDIIATPIPEPRHCYIKPAIIPFDKQKKVR